MADRLNAHVADRLNTDVADRLNTDVADRLNMSDEHAAGARLPGPASVSRRERPYEQPSPHAAKFRAATALLIGIAIGAIAVALVVLASGERGGPARAWSDWRPPDGGIQGAREIADHIAPLYRISGTDQLDVVTVVNLASTSQISAAASGAGGQSAPPSGLEVAVRPNASSSAVSLLNGQTIAYNLCGIGSSNCVIGVGTPSADRLLLLRREALELALYTFKYIGGVNNVVAILPPGHTTQGCSGICPRPNTKQTTKPVDIAVLFLRDELKPWLEQPLRQTFPEQFPPTVSELSLWRQTTEAGLVDQITARGLFSEQLVKAQDGSNLMVLDPLPPQ